MDTFGWSWRSELGRDEMLRDEIVAAEARASSRMRSQLRTMQGSLETRITALSAAFDAYVELGDVREQLMEFGDTRLLRRDAIAAVQAMAGGAQPEPLDPDRYDDPYWLLDATNAVIAVAAGRRNHELEERIAAAHPAVLTYVVACSMALGHGDRVTDLLPRALIGDGTLNGYQRAIADGVVAGLSGPDGMARLHEVVTPTLDRTDWSGWLTERATLPSDTERLLAAERFLSGPVPPPDAPAVDQAADPSADPATVARGRLQGLVSTLVGEGSTEEAALLRRAAELRRRIEHPESAPRSSSDDDATGASDAGGDTITVVDWLTELAQDAGRPEAARTVVGWFTPRLRPVVEQLPERPAHAPVEAVARHRGFSVTAGPDGVDAAEVERLRAGIGAGERPWNSTAIATAVFGAAVMIIGVVTATGETGVGLVIAAIGLAVIGGGVAIGLRRTRSLADDRAQRSAALDEAVRLAEERVAATREERADGDAAYVHRRRTVLDRLTDGTTPS